MNLRESRVLAAVQRLGAPTSIEVAEACQYTTTEARGLLRDLADRGQILQDGRRWTVPSAALTRDLLEGEVEVEEPGIGCGLLACILILVLAAGLIGLTFFVKEFLHG